MVHVTAHTKPLTLLSVVKSNFESLVWLQLCNPQGVALSSFVHVPPRVPRPFASAPVNDMSLTRAERLRVVGCGLNGKLVQLLSLGVGRRFEPPRNRPACHKMMDIITRRAAAELAAALRDEVAKKAEELCASGQCANAAVPLQSAVDLGDLPSRALQAWLLMHGREGFARDSKRGVELAKEGASLGCHHCQGVLALCYFRGNGCRVNLARSLELARESSGRGSRYGQYTLGLHMHQYTYGNIRLLAQNHAEAAALYRLAAAEGLGEAQAKLGNMYGAGEGVARDHSERLQWLLLAAAQGLTDAMFDVAICYERKDVAEAIRWCRRAEAASPSLAGVYLRRLEEKMERKQGSRK
jgi:TPR repeat protein